MSVLKREFARSRLPAELVPYGVLPTGYECGIIECIPHSKSRAELGEVSDGGLSAIFARRYGPPGGARYERARDRLVRSEAGAAVASYLLWAKDRHNGNLMLDDSGRMLHIDFGFILGISPGGNLGFESAGFKLSYELAQVIDPGMTKRAPSYRRFVDIAVKGYLIARECADEIVALVAALEPSKLPCFSLPKAPERLRERMRLDLDPDQAAAHFRAVIDDAYDKWTTGFYDYVQYLQNGIPK